MISIAIVFAGPGAARKGVSGGIARAASATAVVAVRPWPPAEWAWGESGESPSTFSELYKKHI